jgi:predicted dehydrogenase
LACQHFIDCIETNSQPVTGGRQGLEMVRILEAASASLKMNGAPVTFSASSEAAPDFRAVKAKQIVHVEAFG